MERRGKKWQLDHGHNQDKGQNVGGRPGPTTCTCSSQLLGPPASRKALDGVLGKYIKGPMAWASWLRPMG